MKVTAKSENVKKEDKYDCKKSDVMDNIAEFSKWVPMRLTDDERKLLHILEGALEVSQITHRQGRRALRLLRLEQHPQEAPEPVRRRGPVQTLTKNVPFFQRVFEIGQHFKLMNPDKMRATYGKLMHMLQDCASSPAAAGARPLPIRTVRRALEQHGEGALALLEDPALYDAVKTVGVGKGPRCLGG